MSLSSEKQLTLMAYADGELEGEASEEAAALVAREPEAARFIAQLNDLGEWVREAHKSDAVTQSFDIENAVMSQVAAIPNRNSKSFARTSRAVSTVRGSRARLGAGVTASLALAAALFMWLRPHGESPAQGVATGPNALALHRENSPGEALGGALGVDVKAFSNSGNRSISVFYLPSANEISTNVVVWVDETGEN